MVNLSNNVAETYFDNLEHFRAKMLISLTVLTSDSLISEVKKKSIHFKLFCQIVYFFI